MGSQLIGLVTHCGKEGATELTTRVVAEFRARSASLLLEEETYHLLPPHALAGVEKGTMREIGERCSMLVVLGGDGTLLRAVHELGKNLCPVFGINLGSLGFLTCANSQSYREAVEVICAERYVLSHRSLLHISVERNHKSIGETDALNDVVISRGEHSRLIKLDATIDGVPLTQYNADGLIVATSTGSTAYSLSAGGPVIMPDSGVFVITPICPHVLTNRSVIVSNQSRITVQPISGDLEVTLAVDGQEPFKIREGDVIHIQKSALSLPLAMLPGLSFGQVLQQKLKWSGTAI